mmetsp:Transcript_31373/g.48679  ORF Transcript_31373/g.48679 Transcript_31373/m.48679 type:complete len:188 (-) Transcript_31373:71-634(-)
MVPQNLRSWFDDPDSFQKTRDITKKQKGAVDDYEYFIKKIIEIEYRMVRLISVRMQPGYKKKVDGKARMVVGQMSVEEFDTWVERLSCPNRPSNRKILKLQIPGFDAHHKMEEMIAVAEWKDGKLPYLTHKNHWNLVKFFDRDVFETYRSCLTEFSVVHNSHTCCVTVHFTYYTEFYSQHYRQWVKV